MGVPAPFGLRGAAMIFTVRNNVELVEAFGSASSGDRIELVAGDFDAQRLKNRDFADAVVITSADPTNPAVFRGALTITDVSNVEITNLRFAPDGNALDILDLVIVWGSHGIALRENSFTGHIPTADEGTPLSEDIDTRDEARGLIEGQPFARGVRITQTDGVVLQNNEFSQLHKGIILDRVQEVEVLGNHLHDLRSDGINLVDAVSVTIAENLMESFHPFHNYDNLAYADHGDFIQWWAGDGGLGIRDLTIRDNALLQGAGSWVQGIFGRSGSANPDGSPAEFSGIRIENNIINTSHTNGIFVGDARDVEIIGNTLLPAPQDLTQPVITSGIPTIHVRTSAKLVGENSYDFSSTGALPRDVRIEGNVVVGDQAFTSYLIDPSLHDALNITAEGNAVLSPDIEASDYWGAVYPGVVSRPLETSLEVYQLTNGDGFDSESLERLSELLNSPLVESDGTRLGTDDAELIAADISGRSINALGGDDTIVGTASNDVLRGGIGSDHVTTGLGADRVTFHRTDITTGDRDVIVDLDFAAGDSLVFSGGFGTRYFDDAIDETNSLSTFRSGDSAIIHDQADLIELVAHEAITAHVAGAGVVELRFDLNGDQRPDWVLELRGFADVGETPSHLIAPDLTLIGTDRGDTLVGGDGDDVIISNGASDLLSGGGGADTFAMSWASIARGDHVTISDLDFAEGDRVLLLKSPLLATDERFQVGFEDADGIEIDHESALAGFGDGVGFEIVSTGSGRLLGRIDLERDGIFDSVLELGGIIDFDSVPVADGLIVGTSANEVLQGSVGKHDQIFGGVGDDLLNGQDGADQMFGGAGDDRYYIDDPADIASEAIGNGYDRVYASVDFTLAENVEAISARNSGDLRLVGNELDNWVTGSSGNNVLLGLGGVDRLIGLDGNDWLDGGRGADVMQGGSGSDNYVVDATNDIIIEEKNAGYDRVYTTVDFKIGAEVEALSARGGRDVDLIGNQSDNWLTGNSGGNEIRGLDGNDRLIGLDGDDVLTGGRGGDVLQGGRGRDTFVFTGGDGIDVITDFEVGSDLLLIDILSASPQLQSVETHSGILVHYGSAGDLIVLQGVTQASLQNQSIFSAGNSWVLDF